jgi:starvation-inducible DNA-binding protein
MLADELKTLLATTFAFYLKAQHFHWNVEGPNFPQYHELFGKIYVDVYESVDHLAEYIRSLDEFSPGSLKRFSELSQISDHVKIPKAELMIKELLADNDKIIVMLKDCFDTATTDREQGVANFLADRLSSHGKFHWFLTATLK